MAQEVYRIDERSRSVSFCLELGEGEHVHGMGRDVFLMALTFEELTEGWLAPWLDRRSREPTGGLDAVVLDAVTELNRRRLLGELTYRIDVRGRRVHIGADGADDGFYRPFSEFSQPGPVLKAYRESAKTHAPTMAWLVARDELIERGLIEE